MSNNNSYIAIDYGTKKSGLAYSTMGFCFAHTTIPTKELTEYLIKYIAEKSPTAIIVGMPYNIDGSPSRHSRRVEEFARELGSLTSLPIILHDERLTTSEARIGFAESGVDGDIDAESARLILEDYIDRSVK